MTGLASPDPLTRALLPVVLHRLSNATQLLTGLNAMLGLEGGEALFEARTGDLGETSARVEDLGWAMAVLGSASGADLLLARREPRGLEILVGLVGEAARRAGAHLAATGGALPRLAPEALDGWQVPWAVASVLLAAALDGEGAAGWSLRGDGAGWTLEVPGAGPVREALARVLPRLPGAEALAGAGAGDGETQRLRLPAAWLADAPAAVSR